MATVVSPAGPTTPTDEKHEEHHAIPLADAKKEGAKVIEVENADYAAALSSSPHLNPLSWASIQLYLVLIVAFMGSMSNGFDGQVRAESICITTVL